MQQMVSKQQRPGGSQAQTIIITAITLFALSGLILGLAVGAFTRPPKTQPTNPTLKTNQSPIPTHGPTMTPTLPPQAGPIGCPQITTYSPTQISDGATPYKVVAQIRDRSGNSACSDQNKPLSVPNIMCKIWLVKELDPTKGLDFSDYKDRLLHADLADTITLKVANSQDQIPEVSGLQFSTDTPQTQKCNDQGIGNWQYTVSSQVPAGQYSIFVFNDWNGFYNYSWRNITVQASK